MIRVLAVLLTISPAVAQEVPTRDDEYIRQQLLAAADEALRDRIINLFEVWMKDPTDQPRRALLGAHNAVSAYRDIVKALESKDWKNIAPPEPPHKLFPPPAPVPSVAFQPIPERGRHRRR